MRLGGLLQTAEHRRHTSDLIFCWRLNQKGVEAHELLMGSAVGVFNDSGAAAALYLSPVSLFVFADE